VLNRSCAVYAIEEAALEYASIESQQGRDRDETHKQMGEDSFDDFHLT
jgi:hypothetical protein